MKSKLSITKILNNYSALKIFNPADLDIAAAWLKAVTCLIRDVKAEHKEIKARAHAAWQKTIENENKDLASLEAAKVFMQTLIADYQTAMQHAIEAERAAEMKLLNAKIARRGREGKDVDELEDELADVLEPVAVNAVRGAGIGTRSTPKAEIVDLEAFLRVALRNKALLTFIEVNAPKLARYCTDNAVTELPGVKFSTAQTFYSSSR